MDNEKIFTMSFAKVYPLLIAKAERKGRGRAEVLEVTSWLTGYAAENIEALLKTDITYGDFFREAPDMNPHRSLIRESPWRRSCAADHPLSQTQNNRLRRLTVAGGCFFIRKSLPRRLGEECRFFRHGSPL